MNSAMHRFANPAQFQRISRVVLPFAVALAVLCGALGLYLALFVAPADYQQGETARIMYIHVPAAMLSSGIYFFMAVMSASFLIWRHTLADVLAREAAPIGAIFTLITLITGMLWGKPTWGAYWVWDARLTSVLILQLLYIGYLAVASAGGAGERSSVASAWIAVIGAINLPIIKYSVEWWNSLHQGASLIRTGGPSIDPSMLNPLLLMIAAFIALFIALLLLRADTALKSVKLRRLQIQRIARKNATLETN
jgi:heme exporter protein C